MALKTLLLAATAISSANHVVKIGEDTSSQQLAPVVSYSESQKSFWQKLIKNSDGSFEVGPAYKDETVKSNVKMGAYVFDNTLPTQPIDVNGLENSKKVGYEIFIRSFADSNSDGIGDLNGITQNVSYLKNLGIDRVWLMPWWAGPSLHKYDSIDYYSVDPEYGTMDDFKNMVKVLRANGIEIDMDIAFNHTSVFNSWFSDFINDVLYGNQPGDIDRSDWFRYSKTIPINKDGTQARGWKPLPNNLPGYFFAAFGDFMPDLNLESDGVKSELIDVIAYWKALGVDGFRLDAPKEGFDVALGDEKPDLTPPEVKQLNKEFWLKFSNTIENYWPKTYLVGENWTTSENELRELMSPFSEFSFPWKNKIIDMVNNGVAMGQNYSDPLNSVAGQIVSDVKYYKEENPEFLSTNFLSNHDRERIRNSLYISSKDDEYKAFIAANLMMALPGMPMIYYGDELLMNGYAKKDVQSSVDTMYRLGFPWRIPKTTDGRNTHWVNDISLGSPGTDYDTYQEYSEEQLSSPSFSGNNILEHYKKLIEFRHQYGFLFQNAVNTQDDTFDKVNTFNFTSYNSPVREIFGLKYIEPNGDEYILGVNVSKGWAGPSGGVTIEENRTVEMLWSIGTTYNNLPESGGHKFSFGPMSMALFKVNK